MVLVGSFADQQRPASLQEESGDVFAAPLASSMQQPLDNGKSVLRMAVEEFGNDFVFPDTVYTLDCQLSQTREIRALRSLLGTLRAQLLKVPGVALTSYVCQCHSLPCSCTFFLHLVSSATVSWYQCNNDYPLFYTALEFSIWICEPMV